jgi:ABC-type sugar transport system permease subunit
VAHHIRNLLRAVPYLLPNLLGFAVFTAVPVLAIFVVAFTTGEYTSSVDPATGNMVIDAQWHGLGHFQTLLRDAEFWSSLWNTSVLMLAIPIQMALALGLAILINQKIPGKTIYRTLLFLPTVAAGVALFMVWRQIFNQEVGLLNQTLEAIGLISAGGGPDWLGDTRWAKPSLLLMLVWIAMGGTNMVLYLAGLQDIDPALYEAAEIDGAGPWDKFRHITWPCLRPTTFFILTTNLIGGIQIFDQVLIMTNGGPEGATSTILFYIYRNIYEFQGKVGYAAAISVVLFLIVFAITLVNWQLNRAAREA